MKDAADLPSPESRAEARAPRVLKVIERSMLILVGGLTVIAAGLELAAIVENRAVTLADILLVPQIFNARRFDCQLDHVPMLMRIFEHCMEVPAFEVARPERQPDFA